MRSFTCLLILFVFAASYVSYAVAMREVLDAAVLADDDVVATRDHDWVLGATKAMTPSGDNQRSSRQSREKRAATMTPGDGGSSSGGGGATSRNKQRSLRQSVNKMRTLKQSVNKIRTSQQSSNKKRSSRQSVNMRVSRPGKKRTSTTTPGGAAALSLDDYAAVLDGDVVATRDHDWVLGTRATTPSDDTRRGSGNKQRSSRQSGNKQLSLTQSVNKLQSLKQSVNKMRSLKQSVKRQASQQPVKRRASRQFDKKQSRFTPSRGTAVLSLDDDESSSHLTADSQPKKARSKQRATSGSVARASRAAPTTRRSVKGVLTSRGAASKKSKTAKLSKLRQGKSKTSRVARGKAGSAKKAGAKSKGLRTRNMGKKVSAKQGTAAKGKKVSTKKDNIPAPKKKCNNVAGAKGRRRPKGMKGKKGKRGATAKAGESSSDSCQDDATGEDHWTKMLRDQTKPAMLVKALHPRRGGRKSKPAAGARRRAPGSRAPATDAPTAPAAPPAAGQA